MLTKIRGLTKMLVRDFLVIVVVENPQTCNNLSIKVGYYCLINANFLVMRGDRYICAFKLNCVLAIHLNIYGKK